jgi:hypothetical protein
MDFFTSLFTLKSDAPDHVPEQEIDTDIPEGATHREGCIIA